MIICILLLISSSLFAGGHISKSQNPPIYGSPKNSVNKSKSHELISAHLPNKCMMAYVNKDQSEYTIYLLRFNEIQQDKRKERVTAYAQLIKSVRFDQDANLIVTLENGTKETYVV